MPVTAFGPSSAAGPGHGTTGLRGSAASPDAAAAGPQLAAIPAAGVVGHGVTRLMARPPAYAPNAPFIPGTPPPKQETAGAHGAHKGRISIR
jgi:hypothetical protein